MKPRLFVLAYYWPPAGGPGVQRWLGFVKYLVRFGWDITVAVPDNAAYPIVDESLIAEIPEGIQIVRIPILEPGQLGNVLFPKSSRKISSGIIPEKNPSGLEKLLLKIRANAFIPDARVGWIGPLVRRLRPLLEQEDHPILITTGPPHSLHLAGLRLKKKVKGITWVADFRDPWTAISYHAKLPLSSRSKKKHQELERRVLDSADHILVTSESTAREFARQTQRPIVTLTNGYDLSLKPFIPDPAFKLVHVGSLLTERNPDYLWDCISTLCQETKGLGEELALEFWGVVSEEVMASLESAGLSGKVRDKGYAPHEDIPRLLGTSQVLLLIESDDPAKREIIPGKLFEYLQSGRPILAIGPKEWEAGKLVEGAGAGRYFHKGNKDSLSGALTDLYNRYRQHQRRIPGRVYSEEKHSRAAIARRLSEYLDGTRT